MSKSDPVKDYLTMLSEDVGVFELTQKAFMAIISFIKNVQLWQIRMPIDSADANLSQLKMHNHRLVGDEARETAGTILRDLNNIEKNLKNIVSAAQLQERSFKTGRKKIEQELKKIQKYKGAIS